MGLNDYSVSYYGRLDGPKPIRTLGEDLVAERKEQMMEDMKSMEERIKRHITECKREVIKEVIKELNETFKAKNYQPKEQQDGRRKTS